MTFAVNITDGRCLIMKSIVNPAKEEQGNGVFAVH